MYYRGAAAAVIVYDVSRDVCINLSGFSMKRLCRILSLYCPQITIYHLLFISLHTGKCVKGFFNWERLKRIPVQTPVKLLFKNYLKLESPYTKKKQGVKRKTLKTIVNLLFLFFMSRGT